MKKRTKILLGIGLVLLGILGFLAYQQQFIINMVMISLRPYHPTTLPQDTTALFEARGNLKSDTAYIFVQGGPNYVLFTDTFNPLLNIDHSENLLKVYPQQAQIFNTSVFAADPGLTQEQAAFELKQSVEMLSRTIDYHKQRSKKVFVITHSFGTEIALEYILNHHNQTDQMVLMGLNLDMDTRNIEAIHQGKVVMWENGTEPIQQDPFPSVLMKTSLKEKFGNLSSFLLNGEKRFTELLKDKDLSNIIYVYGEQDASVGRPKPYEIDFLKEKGVEVIKLDGGHMSMWTPEFMNELNTKLTQGS